MSRRPPKTAPVIVKRPPEERRKLPPELEAFARSDDEKLRIRRPRTDSGKVRDPREGYAVAGVANRDARAVYDVRSEAMQALWADGAADEPALAELGQLLHEALRLELWRARRLTDFAAFAEEVIGVPAARARSLAERYAEQSGESLEPLSERAIALWLRTEAGAYEGDEGARARIRTGEGGPLLELSVSLPHASTALAGVGARHLPLARTVERRDREPDFREGRGEFHEGRRDFPEGRGEFHEGGRDVREGRGEADTRGEVRARDDERVRDDERGEGERAEEFEAHDAPVAHDAHGALGEDAPSALHEPHGREDEGAEPASDAPEPSEFPPAESATGSAPPRLAVGGARLLTRKPQPAGEPWTPRRDEGSRPDAARGRTGAPPFRGDRGRGDDARGRSGWGRDSWGEAPRRGEGRGDRDRPRFGREGGDDWRNRRDDASRSHDARGSFGRDARGPQRFERGPRDSGRGGQRAGGAFERRDDRGFDRGAGERRGFGDRPRDGRVDERRARFGSAERTSGEKRPRFGREPARFDRDDRGGRFDRGGDRGGRFDRGGDRGGRFDRGGDRGGRFGDRNAPFDKRAAGPGKSGPGKGFGARKPLARGPSQQDERGRASGHERSEKKRDRDDDE